MIWLSELALERDRKWPEDLLRVNESREKRERGLLAVEGLFTCPEVLAVEAW